MTEIPETRITPESILWKYGGDTRTFMVGASHGILQLMHWKISEAVNEHSRFWEDPWERVFTSIPNIIGTIYDESPEVTGRSVRDFHAGIGGVDDQGRKYHALHPDAFGWAHCTFMKGFFDTLDRFTDIELDSRQREQAYQEMVVWYGRYNMPTHHLPSSYEEFCDYWQYMVDEKLEMTAAASRAIDMARSRETINVPGIPTLLMKLGRLPVGELVYLTSIGGLPDSLRQRLDIPWSDSDQVRLRGLEKAILYSWRFIPPVLREQRRARLGKAASRAAEQPIFGE